MTRCHLVGGMTGVTLIRGQQFVSILSILVLFFLFLVILLAKIELLANIFERLVFWLCSQIDYFFFMERHIWAIDFSLHDFEPV